MVANLQRGLLNCCVPGWGYVSCLQAKKVPWIIYVSPVPYTDYTRTKWSNISTQKRCCVIFTSLCVWHVAYIHVPAVCSITIDSRGERDWKRKLPGIGSALLVVFLPQAWVWYDYSPPTDRGLCKDTQRTSHCSVCFIFFLHCSVFLVRLAKLPAGPLVPLLQNFSDTLWIP